MEKIFNPESADVAGEEFAKLVAEKIELAERYERLYEITMNLAEAGNGLHEGYKELRAINEHLRGRNAELESENSELKELLGKDA